MFLPMPGQHVPDYQPGRGVQGFQSPHLGSTSVVTPTLNFFSWLGDEADAVERWWATGSPAPVPKPWEFQQPNPGPAPGVPSGALTIPAGTPGSLITQEQITAAQRNVWDIWKHDAIPAVGTDTTTTDSNLTGQLLTLGLALLVGFAIYKLVLKK